jgi:hypothetical protein
MGFLNRLFVRGDLTGLEEWVTDFDMEDVDAFLARVSSLVESGFGAAEVARLTKRIRRMKVESDRWFSYRVRYAGREEKLKVYVFMDDIDTPEIAFHASPALCAAIRRQDERLSAELR